MLKSGILELEGPKTSESGLRSDSMVFDGAARIHAWSQTMKQILIVGMGEVGSHLAKVLSTEGHAVTVVDQD